LDKRQNSALWFFEKKIENGCPEIPGLQKRRRLDVVYKDELTVPGRGDNQKYQCAGWKSWSQDLVTSIL
jgi:hypothetical protein